MQKPLVATVLVSAVAGILIAGLAPVAAAAGPVGATTNRGWQTSADHGFDDPVGSLRAGD